MTDTSTIQLDKSVIKELKRLKRSQRETYTELIKSLIETAKKTKLKNQYDEFLHKIQQKKMRELWQNKEDEAWENV
jgi:predicted CopG family antitoxin